MAFGEYRSEIAPSQHVLLDPHRLPAPALALGLDRVPLRLEAEAAQPCSSLLMQR